VGSPPSCPKVGNKNEIKAGKVALRSVVQQTFLCAMTCQNEAEANVVTQQRHLLDWEQFVLVTTVEGKVAIKTFHNTFLSAWDDDSVRQQPHNLEWETFEPVCTCTGAGQTVAFKTWRGKFLKAAHDGMTVMQQQGNDDGTQFEVLGITKMELEALSKLWQSSRTAPEGVGQTPSPAPAVGEMQQCLAGIQEAQAIMRDKLSAFPEDVMRVLVMGQTGAGKSMLVNALAGRELKVVEVKGTRVVEAVSPLPELKIGHTVQSETTMLGRHYDAANKLVFWDCPGFFDSRGAVQDVVNGFAIDQLLQGKCRIKVLLVIEQSKIMESRAGGCVIQLEKLAALFPEPEQLHAMTTLVVTKLDNEESDDGRVVAKDPRHREHLTKLNECGHDVATGAPLADKSLGPFLSRNAASRIFSGGRKVSDKMVGKPYVIPDVAAIIEALKRDPVQSPDHKIHLDHPAMLMAQRLVSASGDPIKTALRMLMGVQGLYRSAFFASVALQQEWLSVADKLRSTLPMQKTLEDAEQSLTRCVPDRLRQLHMQPGVMTLDGAIQELRNMRVRQTFLKTLFGAPPRGDNPFANRDVSSQLDAMCGELRSSVQWMQMAQQQQAAAGQLRSELERCQRERAQACAKLERDMRGLLSESDRRVQALQAQIAECVRDRKMTEEVAQQELKRVRAEEEAKTSKAIAEMNKKIREQQTLFDANLKKLQDDMRRAQEVAEQRRRQMEEELAEQQRRNTAAEEMSRAQERLAADKAARLAREAEAARASARAEEDYFVFAERDIDI
jgi:GTP-binding protein EngB required for normal cell division